MHIQLSLPIKYSFLFHRLSQNRPPNPRRHHRCCSGWTCGLGFQGDDCNSRPGVQRRRPRRYEPPVDLSSVADRERYKGQLLNTRSWGDRSRCRLCSQKPNWVKEYFVSLAVKVFYSVIVEDAEGHPRFLVDFLRVLAHVCFFLDSLKFPKEEDRGIFNGMLLSIFFSFFWFLFDEIGKNCMVDGKPVDGVELFD